MSVKSSSTLFKRFWTRNVSIPARSIIIVERHNSIAFGVWITGLPASGKSTVAAELAEQMRDLGIKVTILESDALRKLFSTEPRYDEQDREYFYGSLAFIGRVLTENGIA